MTAGHNARIAAAPLGVAGLAVLALLLWAGTCLAEPTFPQLTGRVVDEAGLLTPQYKAALVSELAGIEAKSTDQVAVVTLKSLQGYPIEDFGYRLGRHWGIGQAGKDNGILLIVAPKERKVRIEVGRGLEPVMTDAMSKLIIDNAILPRFRSGDFAGGIRDGVRDIKDVLLGDAEAVKQRAVDAGGSKRDDVVGLIIFLFWLAIVIFVMGSILRSAILGHPMRPGAGRTGAIPGSSDHWSGGWSGGSGGGGWSGGGGGFGGGGSSGSW